MEREREREEPRAREKRDFFVCSSFEITKKGESCHHTKKHSTLSLVFFLSLSPSSSLVKTKGEKNGQERGRGKKVSPRKTQRGKKKEPKRKKHSTAPSLSLSLPLSLKIFPPPSARPFSTPLFLCPRRQTSGGGGRSAPRRSGAARAASAPPATSTSWPRSGSCKSFFC